MSILKKLSILMVVAFALALVPSDAEAQAWVVRADDLTCRLDIPDTGFVRFDCDIQWVITPSGNRNVWIHGNIQPGYPIPEKTTHINPDNTGYFCTSAAQDFDGVATKSGRINMTCREF